MGRVASRLLPGAKRPGAGRSVASAEIRMTTAIILLAMVVTLLLLRLAAWQGLYLGARLFARSSVRFRRSRTREQLASWWATLRSAFPAMTRWLEARLSPSQFEGLPLTLVAIAGVYAAALLGGLVEQLLEADDLVRLDEWVNRQLAPLRTDGMLTVFAWMTDLGGSATFVAVALATTGLLWTQRRSQIITPLWVTIIGSQFTTYLGKYVLERQRPEFVTEVVAVTPSFPSGHATSAMAVYGFIAYIVARDLAGPRQRFEVIYWTAVGVVLIGFSRMLLSLHYASDVVAGFLVGGFWLLLGIALAEKMGGRDSA